uniref:Uncharacterized protein n=1 Tax=Arundo donax TaxID=35708 RepID=A0A0A8ZUF2_ARUDO
MQGKCGSLGLARRQG